MKKDQFSEAFEEAANLGDKIFKITGEVEVIFPKIATQRNACCDKNSHTIQHGMSDVVVGKRCRKCGYTELF